MKPKLTPPDRPTGKLLVPAVGTKCLRPLLAALAMLAAPLPVALGQETETVELSFVRFPHSDDAAPLEVFLGEGKTLPIKARGNAVSKPVEVPRMPVWTIGKSETAPGGGIVFREYGSASALDSGSQLLLLVSETPEPDVGIRVIPVDNGEHGFGPGEFLLLNLASFPISGNIGEETFSLETDDQILVLPEPGDDARSMSVRLNSHQSDKPRPFFSSMWPVDDRSRNLVFFYHDRHNDRLRFHAITDFP